MTVECHMAYIVMYLKTSVHTEHDELLLMNLFLTRIYYWSISAAETASVLVTLIL